MLFGHWLEARSVLRASRALEELVKMMPTVAHLIVEDEVLDVPIHRLRPGDLALVKPWEKIPSDGVVVEGESFVNEALLTGESRPVYKRPGDKVIGGSINGGGFLKIRIERVGEDTYLSQVIKLVEEAQRSRSRAQSLADRAAALLFYIAVGVGAAAYLVWSILGSPVFGLERSITVLVTACPHALGLAIPLVVAISSSMSARSGILIRNRNAFELMRDVDVIVFDKTGTLTRGEFGVSDVVSFIPEVELLRMAAGVEQYSEHVIAKAIVDYARMRGVNPARAQDFKAMPGGGVYGKVDGHQVHVGGIRLLEELGLNLDKPEIERLRSHGKTLVFVVVDGVLAGVFALSDIVREESREAVQRLRQMGFKVYMLTGDAEEVARQVAEELGVDEYYAQLMPHEKAEKIRLLRERGFRVAMVGDGVNDAPAIATADVGIAIGAGTDVAIESADIILVRNDPRDVVKLVELSRRAYSKMVQNLLWAAGYNLIAIPLAAGVLAHQGLVLSPSIGALLMSLSDVIVAVNAQTLRRHEPRLEIHIRGEPGLNASSNTCQACH